HDPPARIEHAGEIRSRIASETTYGGGAMRRLLEHNPRGREDRRRSRSPMSVEEVGFARDSPLEGAGFEPSVPRPTVSLYAKPTAMRSVGLSRRARRLAQPCVPVALWPECTGVLL